MEAKVKFYHSSLRAESSCFLHAAQRIFILVLLPAYAYNHITNILLLSKPKSTVRNDVNWHSYFYIFWWQISCKSLVRIEEALNATAASLTMKYSKYLSKISWSRKSPIAKNKLTNQKVTITVGDCISPARTKKGRSHRETHIADPNWSPSRWLTMIGDCNLKYRIPIAIIRDSQLDFTIRMLASLVASWKFFFKHFQQNWVKKKTFFWQITEVTLALSNLSALQNFRKFKF